MGAAGGGGGGNGGNGGTSVSLGCLKMDMLPVACPTPPVTYGMVQSVFQTRCVSACHNDRTPDPTKPGMTLWGLTDYEHVKEWTRTIRDTVGNCIMPPVDAGISMTIEDRIAILQFLSCGLPQ